MKHISNYTMPIMIEASFRAAMTEAGLASRDPVITDGKLHRFRVEGNKPGTKNGWYVLFSDGVPSGAFGSWKTGSNHKWCMKAPHALTLAERAEHKHRMDAARQAREAEDQSRKQAARDKAAYLWKSLPSAPDDHSYLVKKGVKNHGLRASGGALVIPLRDSSGTLHSLQFINGEGNKRFLSGGRKRGCYFGIGQPKEKICIAEGYATAASIHEATGEAVAIAFDAGNLRPVAEALRQKFPGIEIILCADNDPVGLKKAREAALATGALLAIPPCSGDFNDLSTGAAQ
jgi:putative DNA primase/helicase